MTKPQFKGHVVVYADAAGVGGAEISAGHLVSSASARITVVGLYPEVVAAIAHQGRPKANAAWRAERTEQTTDSIVLSEGPLAFLQHWQTFRRLKPDVIHLNLCTPWAGATALAAALCTPAQVVRVDQLPLRTTDLATLLRTRFLSLRVDAHVAVGRGAARLMEDFYALGRGSVISIPNGVPDRSPQAVPPAAELSGPLRVGSVGRLDPMKGHDVLLQSIALVPHAKLTILGEGDWRSHLEQMARSLGIEDRVAFPGWVNPQDYLPQFDVVVQPSRSEGFPLAIAEAMLAARPVIATRVGSVAEAVADGETGLLIEKNDAVGLAVALRRLQEPGLAAQMGQRGRAMAATAYTANVMAASYEALWQRLCDRPVSPGAAPRLWVGRPRD
ncbi:MAG: glycosyltransferase [Elainellaceae cyanobacterium]